MRSSSVFCLLRALCVAWITFGVASVARADIKKADPAAAQQQRRRVSIRFDAPSGELPDFVCVVGASGGATAHLATAFPGWDSNGRQTFAPQPDLKPLLDAITAEIPTSAKTKPNTQAIAAARVALGQPGAKGEPTCSNSLCDAAVVKPHLPASTEVACSQRAGTTLKVGERARVVVLELQFFVVPPALPPQIVALSFDGQAVVDLDAFLARDLVTATVLGGHYLAGAFAQSEVDNEGFHRLSVSLSPRCALRDVELSDLGALRGEVKVSLDLSQTDADAHDSGCARSSETPVRLFSNTATVRPERRVEVLLPMGLKGSKRLRIESVEDDDPSYFRAVVPWSDSEPPARLTTRFEAVSFKWRRNCTFPAADSASCPRATLSEVDVACHSLASADPELCAYRCEALGTAATSQPPADSSAAGAPVFRVTAAKAPAERAGEPRAQPWDFALPVAAQFSSNQRFWGEQLLRPNMVLTSYLAHAEEFITLAFPGWTDADFNEVDEVGVLVPSGDWQSLQAKPGEVFAFPGACGADVKYQLSGGRIYAVAIKRIDHGVLNVDRPGVTSRYLRARLRIGVGESFSVLHQPDWKGAPLRNWPQARVELGMDVRPPGWPISIEPHIGAVLTEREFYAIARDDTSAHPQDSVFYVDGVLGVTVLYYSGLWGFGPSLDLRYGRPLFSADGDEVGSWDGALAPGIVAVFQSWKRLGISVWGDARYVTSEEIDAFDTDFHGKPQMLRASRDSVAFGIGLGFGFF